MLTFGSLFAGIGGFDLGLERAGMRCLWQCEIDPYAVRVLEKHWPDVLRVPDIRDLGAGTVPPVDLVCGGFPCQGISYAGLGLGLADERSGLWAEMLRVVRELRPRYVVVENVSALLVRGLDVVLGGLAACGYDAEWDCIPASAIGAPHRRDRVWIVAYPSGERGAVGREARHVAGAARAREGEGDQRQRHGNAAHDRGADVAYADRPGREERRWAEPIRAQQPSPERGREVGDPDCMAGSPPGARQGQPGTLAQPGTVERTVGSGGGDWHPWLVEPDVGRVADGVPARVDRLRCLGNAIVPQIAELIGRRIVDFEEGRLAA